MAIDAGQVTFLGVSALPTFYTPSGAPDVPTTPTPTPPEVTQVFGWWYDAKGNPIHQATLDFVVEEKIESGSVVIESGNKVSTSTDENGYLSIYLIVGSYTLDVCKVQKYCLTVPSNSPINIQELI